jgi:hypothetical protein
MFNKSLDSILGTFTKVQADLSAFVERASGQNSMLQDQVKSLNVQIEGNALDIERATSVIAKIESLVN